MTRQRYPLCCWHAWVLLVACFTSNAFADKTQQYALKDLLDLPLKDLLNMRVSVASRFSESMLETGSTSSVIDRAQWRALGARRFKDALDMQPGIIVLPTIFGAEPVYIRGYTERNNTNGVATLLDGVEMNILEGSAQFTRQNINLGTLQRIEVIRGPGSSLYGDTAFHGVLDLRSFDSTRNIALFDVDYSGNGYHSSTINYSYGFAKSRINLAVANSGQTAQNQRYDYIDSNGNSASSERDLIFNSTTLIFKWDRQWNVNNASFLRLYWDDNRYDDFYSYGTTTAFDGSSVAADDTGGVDSQLAMVQLGGRVHLNSKRDLSYMIYRNKSTRTFYRTLTHNTGHLLGSNDPFVGIGHLKGDGSGEYSSGIKITLKQHRINNFRWSMDISSKRTHMGEYTNTQSDENGDIWVSPSAIVFDQRRLAFSDFVRSSSGIGLDSTSYMFGDTLLLKLGGRFDHYNDFGTVFSPRAGTIYRLDNNRSYKINFGRAFRAPSAGELKGYSNSAENPNLGAEIIDTVEVSFNSQRKTLVQEYTLFRNYWRDAITYSNGMYDNSGLSSAYGAEGSVTYQVNHWQLLTTLSYIRSHNDQTHTEYVAFPKWIINTAWSYMDQSDKTHWQISNRIHLGAREGQINSVSLPNPEPLKDYWRIDCHVSRPWNPQASISLDIRNIFNRKNFLPSVQDAPSSGGLPDEERSIKIGMQFVW